MSKTLSCRVLQAPVADRNDRDLAGRRASDRVLHGPYSRYSTYAVHTRFDRVIWMTVDAEQLDENQLPEVVRQSDTFEGAIEGLETELEVV